MSYSSGSGALARRFQYLVDQLAKGNKKQFAELTGKSASHVYKICRGASRPSLAYLEQLNDAFRIDLNWLLTGEQADRTEPVAKASNDDLVHAPMFDVQASAGMGMDVHSEDISDYFTFNKQWLSRELGVSGDQLVFVTVSGDSMEPTLFDGDRVLVDMGKKSINSHSAYLLHTEQGLLVKRLVTKEAGTIQVISDNPTYDAWQVNTTGIDGEGCEESAFNVLDRKSVV